MEDCVDTDHNYNHVNIYRQYKGGNWFDFLPTCRANNRKLRF